MSESQLKERIEVTIPKKIKVIMHNDDYTTIDFVVMILMDVFNKDEETAEKITLKIDSEGSSVVGIYVRDIAFSKVKLANEIIKMSNFPLKITTEEE